jgi:hypothetical protein
MHPSQLQLPPFIGAGVFRKLDSARNHQVVNRVDFEVRRERGAFGKRSGDARLSGTWNPGNDDRARKFS